MAGLALYAGFLLIQLPALRHLFDLVATLLAATAAALLKLAFYDVLRNGMELRDGLTGHAIAVTSACDGHGLLISLVAAFLWLGSRITAARPLAHILAVAVGAILLFNLLRILALFLSLGAPDVARVQHVYIAPLVSMLLVAGLALHARKLDAAALVRSPAVWLVAAVVIAVLWYPIARATSCGVVVPVGNALLGLLPGRLTEAMTCATSEPTIVTTAVMSASPLTVLTLPFDPADFTLAIPLVLASLLMVRRPWAIVLGVLTSIVLFALAMTLGATTMSHDQAMAAGTTMLAGKTFLQSYAPPGDILIAVLKAMQNTLVHFNLFLLPLVLAGWPSPSPPAPAAGHGRRRRK